MELSATRYAPTEHLRSVAVDDSFILIDQTGGSYYGLNEVGSKIWSKISDGLAVEDIAAALLLDYDIEPARLAEDIRRLIADLLATGLIRAV